MSHIPATVNTSSGPNVQEEAARPPLPPRVHEFVVDVADRGPSSRALGITVVAAFAAAVLLMFAMPKRDPHEVRLQPAIEPVTAQVVSPPSEPVPPVGRIESVAKPSAVMPAAVAASTAPRPERVEPTIRIDEPPARIVEVSRGDPTPEAVGATGRAPIDILVAPQMQPREREPAIVSSVISRDQLAPRPPPPEIAAKFTSE